MAMGGLRRKDIGAGSDGAMMVSELGVAESCGELWKGGDRDRDEGEE